MLSVGDNPAEGRGGAYIYESKAQVHPGFLGPCRLQPRWQTQFAITALACHTYLPLKIQFRSSRPLTIFNELVFEESINRHEVCRLD